MEWFVYLAVAAVVVVTVGAILVYAGVRKLRRFSRSAFGTDSLLKGFELQRERLSETPKSVSGMTKFTCRKLRRIFLRSTMESLNKRLKTC